MKNLNPLCISFLLAICFFLNLSVISAQGSSCNFSDDFSSANGWTQIGSNVTIANGAVEYQNGAGDGEQRRVYKPLGVTLNATDTWKAEVDVTPKSVGDYGGPFTGHTVLSLTAGTAEPHSDCPDVPCTGYPTSTQDAVNCNFITPANPSPNGQTYFGIWAFDGPTEYVSQLIPANTLNVTYYVRMERLSATHLQLSVFTDAARTVHLAGSPVSLAVPATIQGLNTVQHANVARGYQLRELTGTVDNLCVNWRTASDCLPKTLVLQPDAEAGKDAIAHGLSYLQNNNYAAIFRCKLCPGLSKASLAPCVRTWNSTFPLSLRARPFSLLRLLYTASLCQMVLHTPA